ncbi:MAG TPA: 4a-hydroxytetrahydrobiopterin dehydratase [Blastocatellia bacterium]|nr:4a-hydroxytetrahydrobiopterin dehydratase [Blastocatellia bacterium]
MSELAAKTCEPCRGGVAPLKGEEIQKLMAELGNGWEVIEEHHLKKVFTFPDFRSALDFTNKVGAIAEEQGHHPDIYLAWGRVEITIWTHKINGLHESDFILAAKIDRLS